MVKRPISTIEPLVDCDFDENYYAYYSDLEIGSEEGSAIPLYIGDSMSGGSRCGKLFVLAGPSGVGKTTLATELLVRLGKTYNLARVVTYTTKSPRNGEVAGVDYHYLTTQEFEAKLSTGFFIEHSQAYGHYYGSPKSMLLELKAGKSFLLIVDQAGAQRIKAQYPAAILIWIVPPHLAELADRLKKRATETSVDIEKRLMIAAHEITNELQQRQFDYIVENDILVQTVETLAQILKAEIQSGSANC